MDYLAGQILDFIKAHPEWAAFVIGFVAFGESFAFLSLLFPGTAILITSGALIEAGILDAFLPVVAGIIGAVLGDAISFWLGQKFGPFLLEIWPFRGRPQELESGIVFFERYAQAVYSSGGSSVLYAPSFHSRQVRCGWRRDAFTSPMSCQRLFGRHRSF